jgi:hypothetical protein
MIIEEGIMNFWTMIGALGTFGCALTLVVLKILELKAEYA